MVRRRFSRLRNGSISNNKISTLPALYEHPIEIGVSITILSYPLFRLKHWYEITPQNWGKKFEQPYRLAEDGFISGNISYWQIFSQKEGGEHKTYYPALANVDHTHTYTAKHHVRLNGRTTISTFCLALRTRTFMLYNRGNKRRFSS